MINEKMRQLGACRSVIRELFEYGKKRKSEIGEDKVFDFSLGNPNVDPPAEVNEGLIDLIKTKSPVALHGYTSADGDRATRAAIAEYLLQATGDTVCADCIYMTAGAAGALTSILTAVANPGEEVICLTPYFPEYRVFIERTGATVREVATKVGSFTPDAQAIADAISEKTAAIIINSPNNPTGALYTEEDIRTLSDVLREAEKKYSKTIYLISDEPYRELVYTDDVVPYPTKFYDDTLVAYSYSKSLSLPGERIGYVFISPRVASFTAVREAVMGAGRALGFVCAPSMLQFLVKDMQGKHTELDTYKRNARILSEALTSYGYEVTEPKGAFYLFVKALEPDATAFSEVAKKFELLLVPSDSFGIKGYVRISYCVTTKQIEDSLGAFKALIEYYEENGK